MMSVTMRIVITLITFSSVINCVMLQRKPQSVMNKIEQLEREITSLKSKSTVDIPTKKLRKLIRRELKNKLQPKLEKSLNELIEKSVQKIVDASLEGMFDRYITDSAVSLTLFNDLQNRMNELVDENTKLQKSLQANSEGIAAKLEHLQRGLRRNCNCEVLLKDPLPVDTSIQTVIQTENPDDDFVWIKPPNLPEGFPILPTGIVEPYQDDMTFNVSSELPDFRDTDSLLLVDDEGLMTRVSLSNSSLRGTLTASPFVEGVAYDSVSQKIFWGSNRNQRKAIYSVNTDGSGLTKIQDGRWVFSLAVDGTRRKVFMSDWDLRVISVMNTNGNGYKILTDYKDDGDPRTIALDTKRRLLYVSYTFAIVRMKYDGSRVRRVTGGIWMQPLTLDIAGNTLYYSIKKNIYKVNLSASNKKSKFVNQMDSNLSYLAFHKDNLYISYQNWALSVDVLNLKDNVRKQFAHVEATSLLRICVMPV